MIQLINYLEKKFPKEKAELWDPVGFSFYFEKNQAEKILICLDVTKTEIEFAINNQVDLIISHHPFLFEKTLKSEYEKAPYKKNLVTKIKKHKINLYSLHTNYDSSKKGTAFQIASFLKFNKNKLVFFDKYNFKYIEKMNFKNIVNKLSKLTDSNSFQINIPKNELNQKNINSIAILPGSGGIEAINKAIKLKTDLIITSDIKWSDWITISNSKNKTIVLDIPHIIESVFVWDVEKIIKKEFKNIKVYTSKMKNIKFNL